MGWRGSDGGVIANPTAGRNESSKNRTLANETSGYSYKNPVIPQGFKAVDIGGAVWRYKDAEKMEVVGWNDGLVIEDVYNGNQFVWVPVDGTKVRYEKWYAASILLWDCSDDVEACPVSDESAQITAYGGFYVARYEAGNANEVNSSTLRDQNSPNNNGAVAPVSRTGEKVWNYISYDNAVATAKLMVKDSGKYGENKSGLITGTQWDTIMSWYKENGIDVMQSWGTYQDKNYSGTGNYFTDVEGGVDEWKNGKFNHIANELPICYLGAGLNHAVIKKNIADLAGNFWEWSAEKYLENNLARGGASDNLGNIVCAYGTANQEFADGNFSFRVVLFVQ